MISNLVTQKRVTETKRKVLEQFYSMFPREQGKNLNVALYGVEENIALWSLQMTENSLYFYTDLQGKILFDNSFFPFASTFSDRVAWVKDFSGIWYIINLRKKELVEIPIEEMPWKNIRDIRHGNLAVLNKENQWGSYFYNQEENTFQQDVPFLWDALEFSRKENLAYVGMYSSRSIVNPLNEWAPENFQMLIKVTPLLKNYLYDRKAYQQFLQQYFLDSSLGVDILKNIETVPRNGKNKLKQEFVSNAYSIADEGFDEKSDSLFNTNYNESIITGSLEEYKRVRGRVLK